MFYLIQRFFFFDKFSPLGDKKKPNVTHTKDFCEKISLKSLDFEDSFLKSPYLNYRFT
jgi:hypothetical protein